MKFNEITQVLSTKPDTYTIMDCYYCDISLLTVVQRTRGIKESKRRITKELEMSHGDQAKSHVNRHSQKFSIQSYRIVVVHSIVTTCLHGQWALSPISH